MPSAFGGYFCSRPFLLQHLESIGRRGPEQVDLVVALFSTNFNTRIGVAVLHLKRRARMGLLERLLERIGHVL